MHASPIVVPTPAHKSADWLLVLGAVFALALSSGPVFHFAFSVFIVPVSVEFASDRATVSLAVSIALLAIALATRGLGWLTDRYGSRAVVLTSAPATAAGLLALAYLPHDIATFIAVYAVVAVISLGTSTLPYVSAVTKRFNARRGLALGCTMAGIGIGVAVLPPISQAMIDAFGWRGAYAGLAALVACVAWPAALLLPRGGGRSMSQNSMLGLSLRQCVAEPAFAKMMIAFMLAAFAMSGVMAHLVPLLGDRGIAPDRAAAVLSIGGIALIVGRIAAGYLLDRIFAPYLAVLFFIFPLTGLLLILFGQDVRFAWTGAALIGLGIGAEVDLIAYMISRYFGLRFFGSIYGVMLTGFMFGNAVGPVSMGVSHARTGNYDAILLASAGALALGCLLMLTLGGYRFAAIEPPPESEVAVT